MKNKKNLFAGLKQEKAGQLKEMAESQEKAAVRVKLGTTRRLIVSFLISVMFFCICMALVKNMTAEEETAPVVVAVQEIPQNTKITEGFGSFTIKEIPVSLLPEGALTDIGQAAGQFTVCGIGKNQILSKTLFTDKESMAAKVQEPLEVSVGADRIAQTVGGTVREGDRINVSAVNNTYVTGEDGINTYVYTSQTIASNVYVTGTFTAAGARVDSHDTEQPVTVINIIIPAAAEESFNEALEDGTLRISRICSGQ